MTNAINGEHRTLPVALSAIPRGGGVGRIAPESCDLLEPPEPRLSAPAAQASQEVPDRAGTGESRFDTAVGRHEERPETESGPSEPTRGSEWAPVARRPKQATFNGRRAVRGGLLAAVTAAVLTPRQRHAWTATAVKIHEQVVQQHRAKTSRQSADDEQNAQTPARALADSLVVFAGLCDAGGRSHEAVAASEEAVAIYRQLASTHPNAHNTDLAAALTALATRYDANARLNEAVVATEEAVAIYRRLASTHPNAHNADLAAALHALGTLRAREHRHAAALAAAEEAATLRHQLADSNPDLCLPDFAASLHLLSLRYDEEGHADKALTAIRRAVTTYRRLAEQHPRAFRPDLAACLMELFHRLGSGDQRAEALSAVDEAISTLRAVIAEDHSHEHQCELAACLLLLGSRLDEDGRFDQALGVTEEATFHYRHLTQADPDRYRADLAASLILLAVRFEQVGRADDALGANEEATTHYRQLTQADPDTYRQDLATSLYLFAVRLSEHGRQSGLAVLEEAVGHYQHLTAQSHRHCQPLASALTLLAIWWAALGRHDEAVTAADNAEAIYRQLCRADPDTHLPELAAHLYARACRLNRGGVEAHDYLREAVSLYRQLAHAHPERHTPDLANCLTALAACFDCLGHNSDALSAADEAAAVYRHLTSTDATYAPMLADALRGLASRLGPRARLQPLREAVGIYRGLAEHDAAYLAGLATNLRSLGACLDELGQSDDALRARAEANAVAERIDQGG
jgi:hypothetical protein